MHKRLITNRCFCCSANNTTHTYAILFGQHKALEWNLFRFSGPGPSKTNARIISIFLRRVHRIEKVSERKPQRTMRITLRSRQPSIAGSFVAFATINHRVEKQATRRACVYACACACACVYDIQRYAMTDRPFFGFWKHGARSRKLVCISYLLVCRINPSKSSIV